MQSHTVEDVEFVYCGRESLREKKRNTPREKKKQLDRCQDKLHTFILSISLKQSKMRNTSMPLRAANRMNSVTTVDSNKQIIFDKERALNKECKRYTKKLRDRDAERNTIMHIRRSSEGRGAVGGNVG